MTLLCGDTGGSGGNVGGAFRTGAEAIAALQSPGLCCASLRNAVGPTAKILPDCLCVPGRALVDIVYLSSSILLISRVSLSLLELCQKTHRGAG